MTSRIREAAADYQEAWHANHPKGCTVAAYVNDEIPGDIFEAGAEWAISEVLKELRSEATKRQWLDSYPPGYNPTDADFADWLESRFKGE